MIFIQMIDLRDFKLSIKIRKSTYGVYLKDLKMIKKRRKKNLPTVPRF